MLRQQQAYRTKRIGIPKRLFPALTASLAMVASALTMAASPASAATIDGPHVTYVDDNSSPIAGGAPVYVEGHGFTGATSVHFGTVNAPSFTVEDDQDISVMAPPVTATGPVEITVTTPAGTSTLNPGDVFTYVAGPTLTSESGSVSVNDPAGYDVGLYGFGLTGTTGIEFGAQGAATGIISMDDQDVYVVPPTLGVGTYPVTVTTPAGTSSSSSYTVPITYDYVPQVNDVYLSCDDCTSTPEGSLAGGQSFGINGSGLVGATEVLFGSVPATDIYVGSDDYLYGTVPAATTAGPVDVRVVGPGGTSAMNAGDVWFYEPGGGTIGTGEGTPGARP